MYSNANVFHKENMALKAQLEKANGRIAYFEKLFTDSKVSDSLEEREAKDNQISYMQNIIDSLQMVITNLPAKVICNNCGHKSKCDSRNKCVNNHYCDFRAKVMT